jgi:hypothetical protein
VRGTRSKDIVIAARHPAGPARSWATVPGHGPRPYEPDGGGAAAVGRTPELRAGAVAAVAAVVAVVAVVQP